MLVLMKNGEALKTVRVGSRFSMPNGDVVSPAYAGWSNAEGFELVLQPTPEPEPLTVESWRETARLSRAEFCLAAMRAGLLPAGEAVAAAKGDWPPTFAAALAAMPDGLDATEAEIIWAAATLVERLHPALIAVAASEEVSDATLDALFGWEA